MDNTQIEKWILEGLTDDEIQAKLDKIEELSHAPSEEAVIALNDASDEPGAAPGPATDTIQGTVTRLVAAIDKANSVQDLTHLTTQDEIFNAVELDGTYLVKVPGYNNAIVVCSAKNASLVFLTGFFTTPNHATLYPGFINAKLGDSTALKISLTQITAADPNAPTDIVNKKYVDDKVAAIEYDTKLYSFTAAAHTFRPDAGWQFVAITQVEVTYDTNYKYVASDVGATSTSGEFEFHGATPKEGAFTYNFDKAAQTITIAQSANFNGLATGGNIRMLVRKVA